MGSIEYRPDRPKPYRARYWGTDGKLHSKSFMLEKQAEQFLVKQEAAKLDNVWTDPNRGRIRFKDWADQWWEIWASHPRRSPNTLEAAESRLRLHVRPTFDRHRLNAISIQVVQRWQNRLETVVGYETLMACRSLLYRILQAAEDDNRRIPFNPVSKVPAPSKPDDPDVIFGRAQRRSYTSKEFGRFLAHCPDFYRDHFTTAVGTGLRPGELLGVRAFRVKLNDALLEVVEVRYDAGKFGSGYKNRPKSRASIRPVPLAPIVREAIGRRLVGCAVDGLVFSGPGGARGVQRGTRSALSINNYRRVYRRSAASANLVGLDWHGPHDLRHTFATWLEEGGIPTRVIDELMGHAGRAGSIAGVEGSAVGRRYRHTTDAMLVRVIEACLTEALEAMRPHAPGMPQGE